MNATDYDAIRDRTALAIAEALPFAVAPETAEHAARAALCVVMEALYWHAAQDESDTARCIYCGSTEEEPHSRRCSVTKWGEAARYEVPRRDGSD